MRGARGARRVAVAIVGALLATACGGSADGGRGGGAGGTFRLGIVEPVAIDPYNAQESEGVLVADQLFTGLYEATAHGGVVPRLATARKVGADGRTWTFTIKGGTRFSNGEPVDAAAFVRGWNRVVQKEAASDVAYHLSGIEGFAAVRSGAADVLAGLSAPTSRTLRVRLSAPDFEFDVKTSHTVFSPVPKVAGAAGNRAYNEAPVGNGPFRMQGTWQHNRSITLVRNDDYGLTKARLARVEISILNQANGMALEYQGFRAGRFDWARVPPAQLPAARAAYRPRGEWISEPTTGMNYLSPVTDNGPLKSPDARAAVSYAIDRKAIVKGVFQNMQTVSTTILPPAFDDAYQPGACASCVRQDKTKARALAKRAGLEPGTMLRLAYNTGAGHEEWIQAIAQQLEDVLGLKVVTDGMTFPQLAAAQREPGASGAYRFSWIANYPTPEAFLYPLLDTASIDEDADGKVGGDNRGRYRNKTVDKLLAQARATPDSTARTTLYRRVERLALHDMALIPTWNRTQQRLADTRAFAHVTLDFHENPNLAEITPR